MAKKPKNFETPPDFFDVAIAALSMEAALEAWGADNDLFHDVPEVGPACCRPLRLLGGNTKALCLQVRRRRRQRSA
jgi:hypothetical protein